MHAAVAILSGSEPLGWNKDDGNENISCVGNRVDEYSTFAICLMFVIASSTDQSFHLPFGEGRDGEPHAEAIDVSVLENCLGLFCGKRSSL